MTQQLACNFDEASGAVLDLSGAGHGFALNNGLKRVTGHSGASGLSKLGGAGTMGVVADPSFISSAAWTVMFWLQNPGNGTWLFRFYNTVADTGHGLLILSGSLRLRLRTAAGANVEVTTTTPPNDNSWHHYAITYDGSVGKLYVDAVLIATTSTVATPAAINRIDFLEATLDNFATDDLRIYDTALDLATITTLKGTSPPDSSGSTGTLDASLSGLSVAMSGTASSAATFDAPLSGLTVAMAGTASSTATLDPAVSGLALSGAGQASSTGGLDVPISGVSLAVSGQADSFGTFDSSLSGLDLSVSGSAEAFGALDAALPGPALSLDAQASADGSLGMALSGPSLALSGGLVGTGALTLVLGSPTLVLRQEGAFRVPDIGPSVQPPLVYTGPPQQEPLVLSGLPQAG